MDKKTLLKLEKEVVGIMSNVGHFIKSALYSKKTLQNKDLRDQTSNIDIEAEKSITEKLHKLLPEAGFIVEEGDSSVKKDLNWVIDPIDGTKEFIHFTPMFFTQCALVYKDNPIIGVIYQPISNQIFSASFGNGTRMNNKQLISTTEKSISKAIIDFDFRGIEYIEDKLRIFNIIARNAYRVRISGARLSPYLITGEIDALIDLFREKKFFDLAPRLIIYKEAGLEVKKIIYRNNKPVIVASNKSLIAQIQQLFL